MESVSLVWHSCCSSANDGHHHCVMEPTT